jgi:hypothetical protein
MTIKLFYDSEFTGLHQHTTLISIGLVSETGQQFYAEFSDYAQEQCDSWIKEHVIQHTRWLNGQSITAHTEQLGPLTVCVGTTDFVLERLKTWLAQFERIEIWADCAAYDWVLFCQLFGGALNLPKNIFYLPNDLVTLFALKGINPDCDRKAFADLPELTRHNALADALIVQACHRKLMMQDWA